MKNTADMSGAAPPPGGDLGALIQAFDWSATSLGPRADWSQSLKTAVDIVLNSPVPLVMLWGPDGVMIYNDAYSGFAGGRHPRLLGSKVLEGWAEVADFNARVLEVGLAGGTLSFRDQHLVLYRNGIAEDVWMNLDYSPVRDESGKPAGVLAVVVETTERVRTEQALRDSEEQLRLITDALPLLISYVDAEERYRFVNKAYEPWFGRPLDQIVGRHLKEMMGEAVYEARRPYVERALAGERLAYTLDMPRPNGARVTDIQHIPHRGPDGQVLGIFAVVQDVTDRSRAEGAREKLAAELAEERRRLMTLLDHLPIAVNFIDPDGRTVLSNPAYRRFLPSDVIPSKLPDAEERWIGYDEAGRRLTRDQFVGARALRGETVSGVEFLYKPLDGPEVWTRISGLPVRDGEGRVTGALVVIVDIDAQKRARETAEALAAEQAAILGQLAEGVIVTDPDGRITFVNDAATRIHGVARLDVAPEDYSETYHLLTEDGQPYPSEELPLARAVLHGDSLFDERWRTRGRDGTAVRAIGRARPVLAEDGKQLGAVLTLRDDTARAASEAALRESEERLRLALDAGRIGAWSLDVGRKTADRSALHDAIFGYPSPLSEWTFERFLDHVAAEDRDMVRDRFQSAVETGSEWRFECRIDRADGVRRWIEGRGHPKRGVDGAVSGFIGVVLDITERKAASEALERLIDERTAERDRLWRLSRDPFLIADMAGRWVSVSPVWTELLGWSQQELVGRTSEWMEHPDDRAKTREEIDHLASGDTTLRFENRFRARDGSYRWFSWTAVPEGDLLYAVARDVTEEKEKAEALRHAEEQLRQSQKMEAVGQLTGGIAHDFNNLLQGIVGSLDLVQKRISQGRTAELDRFVSGAMTSANRAAALTHRLLAFSRRQPLDPKPVKANPLVASMEDLLRRTMGEQIELELVLAGGLWLTLCDQNQLESAILNLAINARDAMPEGGKLTIETCNAHLDDAYAAKLRDVNPGQYVCICVTDTGAGMPPDVIERAFDPFFTTKPIGQGTGLGLSMIYGFTRQSEGYAKIYSEIGQGTTVKLYLPRYRGDAADADHQLGLTEEHEAEEGEVVLVVEDELVVRGLILEVLHELGYRALEAVDGPSGLQILQSEQRVDLLVTDIGLPGLNGRQLAEAARGRRPDLKVLFMTGYAGNAVVANGFLEPGMAMITKPFAMEALATRIRDIIGGN